MKAFKKSHYYVLGGSVLLALLLLNLPPKAAARLKLDIGSLFLPLFGLVSSSQALVRHSGQPFIPRRRLLEEIDRLRLENQQLRLRALQSAQLSQENDRLRQAVLWRAQSPWRLRLARVVARDPANWWRTLRIDLGSRDGVQPNMPVLTPDGLVGKVQTVGAEASQVLLLGDPNLRVPATVQRTGDDGIITPSPENVLDPSMIELDFLRPQNGVKPGDLVVTSGLAQLFPAGIPIGKVVDQRAVGYGLYAEARLKLLADVSHLREVWVKFP